MTFDEAKKNLEGSVGREGGDLCEVFAFEQEIQAQHSLTFSTRTGPLLLLCYASNGPFALRFRLLYLISEQKAIGLRLCHGQPFTSRCLPSGLGFRRLATTL
ncbi:unnamed protein product [Ectocarpus sp. 8 AP-2014]